VPEAAGGLSKEGSVRAARGGGGTLLRLGHGVIMWRSPPAQVGHKTNSTPIGLALAATELAERRWQAPLSPPRFPPLPTGAQAAGHPGPWEGGRDKMEFMQLGSKH
jgi:hypothetical protein